MEFLTTFLCIAVGVFIGDGIAEYIIYLISSKMDKEEK